jgi:drug/metabolite transporter (DMT)-like permease
MSFSFMSVFVKWWAPTIPQPWLVFSRGFIMLVVITIWGWWTGQVELRPRGVKVLAVRGVAGFLGVSSLFYAVAHLPLPVASVLNWCAPLFVVFFSKIFLSERIPPRASGFVALAFLALTQVVGLKWNGGVASSVPLFPALVALGGAASAGVAYTAVRAASARFTSSTIIFHFSWIATLLATPWIIFSGADFDWRWLPGLLAVGVFATFGQVAMTAAYRRAPAPVVSTMSLFNAPFSALLGYWVFGEWLELQQWLGISVLMGSIAAVAYLQHRVTIREQVV